MVAEEQTPVLETQQLRIEIERLKLEKERLIFEKENLKHVWHSPLLIAIIAAALAGFGNLVHLAISNVHDRTIEKERADAATLLLAIDKKNSLKTIENFSLLVESNVIQSDTIKNSLTNYLVKRTKLRIKSLRYKNDMRIQLVNKFGAPVRIVSANFSNSNKSAGNKLHKLFEFDGVNFDTYTNLPSGRVVNSGEEIDLVKLTKEGIARQNKQFDEDAIHEKWTSQKKGIEIHIVYTILPGDKKMELKLTLK